MPSIPPFCTCTDHACACHPANHDRGCAPCVAKNLHQHEVPACFFRAVSPDKLPEDSDDWSWESFARHVQAHAR